MKATPRFGSRRGPWSCRRPRQRGSALFAVFILAVVMTTVFGALILYVNRTAKLERRSGIRLESVYVAEYAFEKAYNELKGVLATNMRPDIEDTTGATNLGTAPTDLFPATAGFTWKTYLTVPTQDGLVVGALPNLPNASGMTYRYLTIVEFDRRVPSMDKPVSLTFQREWVYSIRPLFQYAIFYNNDLELFPGSDFVVGGRVHSNGKIYTGTNASITYQDYVTEVNGWSNRYSPKDPRTDDDGLKDPSFSKGAPIATTREEPPCAFAVNLTDDNANNDGPRELIEIPASWQDDDSSEERMYNKAGLKILVNTTTAASTADSGVTVPARASTSSPGRTYVTKDGTIIPRDTQTADLMAYLDALTVGTTTQDYREATSISTTDVDVAALKSLYDSGGLPATIPNQAKWPNDATVPANLRNDDIPAGIRGKELWNGILYITDITDGDTHPTGIKLTKGSSLPTGSNGTAGLTVATNNPAYIVGDYNTGGTGTSVPVNGGTNLAADNHASSYTVQPAAVIADAVTIMSSSWSSSYNASTTLDSRDAVNTTINTALISGIVESVPSGTDKAYSGGVENYLRLLEDWGGKRLTYYGSIVNLYPSKQATKKWITTGTYYQAPSRNWYFDVNFKDPTKLPPGTPMLRGIRRGQWAQLR